MQRKRKGGRGRKGPPPTSCHTPRASHEWETMAGVSQQQLQQPQQNTLQAGATINTHPGYCMQQQQHRQYLKQAGSIGGHVGDWQQEHAQPRKNKHFLDVEIDTTEKMDDTWYTGDSDITVSVGLMSDQQGNPQKESPQQNHIQHMGLYTAGSSIEVEEYVQQLAILTSPSTTGIEQGAWDPSKTPTKSCIKDTTGIEGVAWDPAKKPTKPCIKKTSLHVKPGCTTKSSEIDVAAWKKRQKVMMDQKLPSDWRAALAPKKHNRDLDKEPSMSV
jgi:hypothetical protein